MIKPVLPNVRRIFIPDPGYVMFDCDLTGADAQVVAWEAEDDDLKAAFRAGLDVHDKNAEDLWGSAYTQLAGNKDSGPKSRKRKECKQGVHLTNYGGTGRTIGMVLGWTTHEAERFQSRWFAIHPGIKTNFQGKVEADLRRNNTVYNQFGYRRVYFDRPGANFTEALAWKPQSTVALVTYKGWRNFTAQYEYAQLLLQDHDNLLFQVPERFAELHREFRKALEVAVPYADPLVIPWGISTSRVSWGDCEEAA